MNDPNPDEDLSALFARQRTADHKRAPGFQAMRTRVLTARATSPTPMPPMWRWALSGTAALGLGLVAVLSLHPSAKPSNVSREALVRQIEQIDTALQKNLTAQEALTAWQAPTDFLLNSIQSQPTP